MRKRLKLPSPAMVVACIALGVALSGASYAAFVLPAKSVGSRELKNKAVTPAKIAKAEAWREIGAVGQPRFMYRSFNEPADFSPLSNYGSGYNTAAFAKDQLGRVHLKGVVSFDGNYGEGCPSWSVFQLPRNYRPAQKVILNGLVDTEPLRFDVQPDGWITLCHTGVLTNPNNLVLDGLSFMPVAAPPERRGAPTAHITAQDFAYDERDEVLSAMESNDDGRIVKYEWDLDGNGSFETNRGLDLYTDWDTPPLPCEDTTLPVTIRLRVTDNSGLRDTDAKTVTVHDNDYPFC